MRELLVAGWVVIIVCWVIVGALWIAFFLGAWGDR